MKGNTYNLSTAVNFLPKCVNNVYHIFGISQHHGCSHNMRDVPIQLQIASLCGMLYMHGYNSRKPLVNSLNYALVELFQ